ncbi:AAA family ATPase [Myxococcota bacterium]|nr:AAA family ATPase [Myxococcota bacterium]
MAWEGLGAATPICSAFGETADPSAHVPRSATESLLEGLLDWCAGDGPGSTLAALVAPPGFGKTHLLRVLELRLAGGAIGRSGDLSPVRASRVLYLPYAALGLSDLCRWAHGLLGRSEDAIGNGPRSDSAALAALRGLGDAASGPFYLLIDDADSLPTATLQALAQGLASERSSIRFVLGLTDDSRAARLLARLDRLAPREFVLRTPLDEAETEAYLRGRLARAGLGTELLDGLDPVKVGRIGALSGGVPRRIHRVVNALLEPDHAALARALSPHPRSDAWLGQPIVDAL